jgi:hypothetical protein
MDNPYLSQRPASAGAGGFHPTEAWLALADLVSDSGARRIVHPHPAGRMTLAELCAAASVPPRVPPRPELLCVIIKSIEIDGSGGDVRILTDFPFSADCRVINEDGDIDLVGGVHDSFLHRFRFAGLRNPGARERGRRAEG